MAERTLKITVEVDTTQGDAALEAFWRREGERQASAHGAGPVGFAAGGGGAAAVIPVAQAGGLPGMVGAGGASAALTASGAPDLAALQAQVAAAGRARAGILAAGANAAPGSPMANAALSAQANLANMEADVQRAELAAMNRGALAAQQGTMSAVSRGLEAGFDPAAQRAAMRQGLRGGLIVGAAAAGGLEEMATNAMRSQFEAHGQVQGLVDEAAQARTAQREIAALRGLPNTVGTAAMMAQEARGAGLSPDQFNSFQTAFQAYAGQYVGDNGQRFGQARAAGLEQSFARFAVGSRGLSAADSARLLATVMARSGPNATDEDILGQAGQLLQVSQLAPGYTGPLLGQLSEVVAESTGAAGELEDPLAAAVLLRASAERNPGTASAYTRAVLRGLRRARANPQRAAELGIRPGMDTFAQLEAIDRAARASGDEGRFLETHGFAEIRQYGGIRAALEYGVRGGAYARAREEAGDRGAMAARVRSEGASYLAGEEGSATADEAALRAARLDRANEYQELARFRRRAEIAVETSGELERGEGLLGATGTFLTSMFFGNRREQLVRAETTRNIRMSLENSRGGRDFLHHYNAELGVVPDRYLESHARNADDAVLAAMLRELIRIREASERDARRIERERFARGAGSIGGGALAAAGAITVRQPGARDGRDTYRGESGGTTF